MEDVMRLKEDGTHAAIIGKSLYVGRLQLDEVLAACPQ
jgi:phosphoribosylformimino-5-aminoimidazole carboxamide ribonucleotide (ProFAR) isomerase